MIVLDASVVTKLLVVEADSDLARSWFRHVGEDIIAPDLIAVEVAQSIVRRVNARDIPRADGQQTLRDWRAMLDEGGIALKRTDPEQMEIAAEVAMLIGHPVKDCIYLGLAMEHSCDLVTSDARFAAKARAVFPGVKLLSDHGN